MTDKEGHATWYNGEKEIEKKPINPHTIEKLLQRLEAVELMAAQNLEAIRSIRASVWK